MFKINNLQNYYKKEAPTEMTFAKYLDLIKEKPSIAQFSHGRLYDMITSKGTEKINGITKYKFFADQIYGIDKALEEVVNVLSSAKKNLDHKKRIILLVGGVGSGKSTIVDILKRGLEEYSRTDEGAIYAIKGCPHHEEPLHLIPRELRNDFNQEYNTNIEGSLCPVCNYHIESGEWKDILDIPIRRIFISEASRVGIGTYTPSDEKTMDISDLVGSINLNELAKRGVESHPLAYNFDGELFVANRGIMEFIEMLKLPDEFLYCLLTLAEEQNIKASRFALISADEVLLAHTNEPEYNKKLQKDSNEALKDRIISLRIPYNLRIDDEIRTFNKLLNKGQLKDIHIAPHTLKIAAIFTLLTRVKSEDNKLTLINKLKIYNDEQVEELTDQEIKEIKEKYLEEGSFGISARQMINLLGEAIVKSECNCVNAIDILRIIRQELTQYIKSVKIEKEQLQEFITIARQEYDEIIKKEIQKVFIYAFEEQAQNLFNKYLDQIEASVNKTKINDPITGDLKDPDEKFMTSIEEQIGVSSSTKKGFREEIMIRLTTTARKGITFKYNSHPRLKEAIERKLFNDVKDMLRLTVSSTVPDEEQLKKVNELAQRLIDEHGYCSQCANSAIKYVVDLLNRT